ncbi:ATP-dependent DNA helicase [Desulfosporosinus fructosivorans]
MIQLKTLIENSLFFQNILPKYGKTTRWSQLELSDDIKKAYDKNYKFVAEAEVGTGKSYAYLVPTLNKISRTGKPFLISTGTIILQDQLFTKDIPELSKYLINERFINKPLQSILGKGKEHYICEKRIVSYSEYLLKNEDEPLSVELDKVIKNYESGSFDERDFPSITSKIWKNINVLNCTRSCPERYCKYKLFKLERESFNYDFLICNHQFLLANLNNPDYINNFSGVVIDEAHNFETAAYSILGDNKSAKDFIQCINKVRLKVNYSVSYVIKLIIDFYQEIEKSTIIPENKEIDWKYKVVINDKIYRMALDLSEKLETIQLSVTNFAYDLKKREDRLGNELDSLLSFAEAVINNQSKIFWVQFEKTKVPRLFYIPCNVDEILYDRILSHKNLPVVFSSATMSTSNGLEGFDYFISSIGIDSVKKSCYLEPVSKKSPYDFQAQAAIYIEEDLKFVSRNNALFEDYLKAKADKIYNIIKATNGKSLVLFTSYDVMDLTYNYLADKILKDLGISSFKQGQGSNYDNLKKFEININSCLFATGSFWEGIDIKGSSLSCVIIDKLPFPVQDPIIDYKIEKLDVERTEILTSEMILRLKQGTGRLIRDEKDKGVIVIMDSRALEAKYFEIIANALPNYRRIYTIQEIIVFLNSHIAA